MKKSSILVAALVLCAATALQAQKINGAGATFPGPIYSKWFSEFSQQHPGVEINYQQIGSGGGIRQVTSGTVDFGATDGPMTSLPPRRSSWATSPPCWARSYRSTTLPV